MADNKKEGKMEIQKLEYLKNQKSFFNDIKRIFYNSSRAIFIIFLGLSLSERSKKREHKL